MNFFDAQHNARRLSRWLVIVYLLATVLIVAGVTVLVAVALYGMGSTAQAPDSSVLLGAATVTLIVIVGATLLRIARLSRGGSRVAEELGAVRLAADVSDPGLRRLRNVVEEMAIASGVPVPAIFVMEQEQAINAFAAGYSPDDAAIAVTRGAIDILDRDELQGVVAHEFSHILNGDMRLNIRMMGVLYGIMVIGLIGRTILRSHRRPGLRAGSRGKNAGGVVLIGLGLAVLGWIGVFLARLIKAAVSRQREFLADASAVQFTRQTDGIANALKKIGGYQAGSMLAESDAEEISHMLFALGARLRGMFATHPPLTERIQALQPQFDESQYPHVEARDRDHRPDDADERIAGLAGSGPTIATDASSVAESIGQPGPGHIEFAGALHRSIPDDLQAALHDPRRAYLVVIALLVDPQPEAASRQFKKLAQKLGPARTAQVERHYRQLATLGAATRLPVLELSFPALRLSADSERAFLLDLGREIIEADGRVDLREFCLYRVLERSLINADQPGLANRRRRKNKIALRQAAVSLLHILAERGQSSASAQRSALDAGLERFGKWGVQSHVDKTGEDPVRRLATALDTLQALNGRSLRTLLEAATATALNDGRISVEEAEILRTISASLGIPMPPLLAAEI